MTSFRCPHCRQPTIGAWQKLKSNGWKPSECALCGGKYVPLVWISLLPLVVCALVLVVGLRFASESMLLVLVAAPLAAFAAAAGIYLLTPLVRYGSAAARWDMWSFVAVFAAALLYAVLRPDPPPTDAKQEVIQRGPTAWHFSDRELGEEYKARLRSQNIPFTVEMRDGKEFILVESRKQVEPKK